MTLTIHDNIDQGTDEWHDIRRGIVTASAVGKLYTPKTLQPATNPYSVALTMQLAAERITGWTEPTYINFDMQRGIDDEPVARNLYAEHYAPVVETGFMVRDDWGFQLGYSPDGVVGDDGLIEIKSRRSKTQLETILADEVPEANMAQLQCGLLVSEREWIDYVSYCAGMPLYVKRVYPQPKHFDAILNAVEAFENKVREIVATYRDNITNLHPTERILDNLEIRVA